MKFVVSKVLSIHLFIRCSIIVILSFLTVTSTFAQQGRHELPLDTVPIGGKEQQVKEEKMEAHDQLASELTSLRDSIVTILKAAPTGNITNQKRQSLEVKKTELDHLIKEFKKTERNSDLLEKGQAALDETRRAIKNDH